jgi:hypothetical protein
MIKTCNKCNEDKDLELFAKGAKYVDGRRNICKKCHSTYVSQYYKDNPEKYAEKVQMSSTYRTNWKRHKLTEEKYNELLALYEGNCHACKVNEAVNIDHDHSCCNKRFSCGSCVRGVLCFPCNVALGILKDSTQNIKNLLEYIS